MLDSDSIYTETKRRTFEDQKTQCTFDTIAKRLKTDKFNQLVTEVRKLDKGRQSKFKKDNFAGFYPSFFDDDNCVKQSNGIIQIDVDENEKYTTDYIKELKNRISKVECVFMAFDSCTTGLKIFVKTDLSGKVSIDLHRKAYFEICNYLGLTDLQDNCGQQRDRFCYYSFDLALFYNPDCVIFNIDKHRLEQELEQEQRLKQQEINEKEFNTKELLLAFESIDRDLDYESRRQVNCGMFSIFGTAAKNLLKCKWNVEDKDKLERDLTTQESKNDNSYGAGTIFKYAYEGGYKALLHNSNITQTNRPPKFLKSDLLTLKQGEDAVKNEINDYFENGGSKFLNVSLGVGKTTEVIKQSCENLDKNIDILVKSHKLANEYVQKFIQLKGEEWTAENVVHIRGRNLNEDGNCFSDEIIHIDPLQHGKHCKICPLSNCCEYVTQFKGKQPIRIYTHNHIYQNSSIWDTRKKQYSIVDEDVISILASADYKTNDLKFITDQLNNGKKMNKLVSDNFDELLKVFTNKDTDDKAKVISGLLYAYARKLLSDEMAEFNYNFSVVDDYLQIYKGHAIHPKYKDCSFLYLDGTGNKNLVNKVLGNDIKYTEIKVKKQSNVTVIQDCEYTYSKQNLMKNDVTDKLLKYCKGFKKIGLISYQYLEKGDLFIRYMADKIGADEYEYFGNVRGTNKFIECDLLIILGRHKIGGQGCETMFKNLYKGQYDERQVIGSDVWMGHKYENNIYKYMDNDLQQIAEFKNDCETEQAIGRARMTRDTGNKTVLILNNLVLNLEVDQLILKNDKQGKVEQLHQYITENNFLIKTKRQIKKVMNCDVSDSELDLVSNDDIKLQKINFFHNGKSKWLDVYSRNQYRLTANDLKLNYKGSRKLVITN